MTPVDVHIPLRYWNTSNQLDTRIHTAVGWEVTPGLAVHTSHLHTDPHIRWMLTHLPSGLAAAGPACAHHIQQAVDAAVAAGIDWTADIDAIRHKPIVAWLRQFDRDDLANGHMDCPAGVWTPDGVRAGVR